MAIKIEHVFVEIFYIKCHGIFARTSVIIQIDYSFNESVGLVVDGHDRRLTPQRPRLPARKQFST